MEQAEVKYAPGMRIIVRGEEWMVKKSRDEQFGKSNPICYWAFSACKRL